jgi:hypothetical protein
MAEIVQSLFGVTPQAYQQAQQDRADAQAMQYARLSPFEQANFAIGRGATGLAGALGGALGGQDPQLQMISARQAISKQINYNDPASIQQGVKALSDAGDTQGAMMLADVARQAASEIAQTGQRQAAGVASLAQANRERAQGVPNDIQLAREMAGLQEKIDMLAALPAGPDRDAALRVASGQLSQLERLTTKEVKGPGFGTDREAVSAEVYDKPFAQLTPAEKAAVNKRVELEQARKAPKIEVKNVMPGDKALVDIPEFRRKVQATIEPQAKTIYSADQALQAIEDSLATDNFASYRAAQVQFAKAIAGAGDLSARELKAAGADPSLLGGTADYLSTVFSSTPTADTQNKIRKTLEAIRKVASNKATAEVDRQRNMALRSPGYDPEAVKEALTFSELAPRVAAPALGAVSGDLAAQAAAEIARRAAGKAK